MQEQNSNGQQPLEKSYIIPLEGGSIISFKTLLVVLLSVLSVSLVIMLCLLGALRGRNNALENELLEHGYSVGDTAAVFATEELPAGTVTNATVAPLSPLEEPDVYAMYTDDTVNLTDIRSEFAILLDIKNNKVLAHKNGNSRMYPASMTKVMTLIVAYEHIEDLNETFTFDYTITDPAYKAGASVAGFLSSETVPMIDILYGIALPSGADATTAVAVRVAGSEEKFAELMNEKAAALGLENTHFVNASGLHDPDHYSTPHDIAIIMRYAMNIPLLAEIMSTYQYVTTATPQHPEGLLLVSTVFSRMYGTEPEVAEIIAGKTGYTNEALNCLVSCAETPSGERYILVTGRAMSTAEEGNYGAVYDAFKIYKNYIPQ
ncbi:MAG: D-alanyl-D-alanine carboxypeptidase [Ruminococcaceae bacterium]|nr:D-alanyl-D-alanine carboxypeptidase [Oscillospiraceae bacterium]